MTNEHDIRKRGTKRPFFTKIIRETTNVPDSFWLQQEEDLVSNAVVDHRVEAAAIGKGFKGGNGQPEANDRFPGTGGHHSE